MSKYSSKIICLLAFSATLFVLPKLRAQITIDPALEVLDYSNPRSYSIGDISVSGTTNLDHTALIAISGLEVGQDIKVPGDDISLALNKLWQQELFTDIEINATEVKGNLS